MLRYYYRSSLSLKALRLNARGVDLDALAEERAGPALGHLTAA
jgi:hypothetical protein